MISAVGLCAEAMVLVENVVRVDTRSAEAEVSADTVMGTIVLFADVRGTIASDDVFAAAGSEVRMPVVRAGPGRDVGMVDPFVGVGFDVAIGRGISGLIGTVTVMDISADVGRKLGTAKEYVKGTEVAASDSGEEVWNIGAAVELAGEEEV